MKNPLIRLREMRDYAGSAERTVIEYLLNNPETVLESNIRTMAAKVYVSPATIVRLCKHLGYSGYREFRQAVIYELALYENGNRPERNEIGEEDSLKSITEKITYKSIASLEETLNMVDLEKMEHCVDLLCSARALYLFGMGASLFVAKDAELKFTRVAKPCFVSEDWHTQRILAQNATPEDLGIIISYSGETTEMIACMKALQANNTPTVAITRFAPSTLASMADNVLYISASESLFRNGAIESRISQLCVIDMLYTAYLTRNYEECMRRLYRSHVDKPNTENSPG